MKERIKLLLDDLESCFSQLVFESIEGTLVLFEPFSRSTFCMSKCLMRANPNDGRLL